MLVCYYLNRHCQSEVLLHISAMRMPGNFLVHSENCIINRRQNTEHRFKYLPYDTVCLPIFWYARVISSLNRSASVFSDFFCFTDIPGCKANCVKDLLKFLLFHNLPH